MSEPVPDMAMVDTLPFAHRSTFSRFSPLGRRNSESVGSAGNSPTLLAPSGRSSDPQPPPPFTIETLAAEFEFRLSTSPTSGFNYLSGDLYNSHQSISRGPLQKSRSLPTVRSDHKRSNSPPLLRKAKSVRFADTQGLPLVEAVHQLSKQDSSYTANKIVPYSDDLSTGIRLATGKNRNSIKRNDSSSSSLESSDSTPPSSSNSLAELVVKTSPPVRKPCQTSPILKRQNSPPMVAPPTPTHRHRFGFTQPSLEPGFFQRVNKECVVLDNIRTESRSLQGTIRVSNLHYEKEVIVRWTHDKWRSSHDTKAVFCTNDGATDRFTFELPINGDDVVFCIRYKTCGQEFWDNNGGNNYTVFSE